MMSLRGWICFTSASCLMCAPMWGLAQEQDAEASLSSRISAEMSGAVSDLMVMASNVRVDKVDKKVRSQLDSASSSGIRFNGLSDRASSNRATLRYDPFSLYSLPVNSELAVYNDTALDGDSSSAIGGYVRVDNKSMGKPRGLNTSKEQEHSGYSLTLGGDYLFRENYLFGLTLGLPFYQSGNEMKDTEIDGLIASGYFSYFRDNWYLDFTASYAVMDTDIERQVTMYTDTVVNNANEADSDIWVFSLGSGYLFSYNYLNIALESSLQYTLSDTDRYSERVSTTSSNYLITKVENVDALESTMLISGLSVSHPFRTPFGVFQPYAKGYLHYDMASGNQRVISQLKSNYSGTILPIVVDSNDKVYGRMHLGLSGAFNRDWYGYAEASSLLWHDDLSAYTFSVGVSIGLD